MPRESTIRIFRSDTAAAVPSLTAGEIAVNIPDQRLFVGNSTGGVIPFFGNGVTGVNGITGGVSITSGSNITITQSGKTITVGTSLPLASSTVTGVASFPNTDFSVSSVGAVSLTGNVARTHIGQTFTGLQVFSSGLSANGLTGTILTPSQTNITSLGTLTSLNSAGLTSTQRVNISAGGIVVQAGGLSVTGGANLTGGSTFFGDIEVFDGAFIRTGGLSVTGGIAGTLVTPAQTNITSVGVLSGLSVNNGLSVTGSATITGGLNAYGNTTTWGSLLAKTTVSIESGGLRSQLGATFGDPNYGFGDDPVINLYRGNQELLRIGAARGGSFLGGLNNLYVFDILGPNAGQTRAVNFRRGTNFDGASASNHVTIMSFDTSDNVGIRTASPGATFDVAGTLRASGIGTFTGGLTANNLFVSQGATFANGIAVNSLGISVTGGIAGTLLTSTQPNVTQVGSLVSLTSAGATFSQRVNVSTGGIVVQAGGLSVTGGANITGGSIFFGDIEVYDGAFIRTGGLSVTGGIAGTIVTPAQTNITSVGTLTSLTTSGLLSAQALNVVAGATFGIDIYAPNMVTGVNGITGAVSITSGSNITITQSGKQITIASSASGGGGITWSVITTDQSLTVNTGVLANKSSGTLTLTLPTTAAVGTSIRVSGMQNTWRVAQNASQKINFGSISTTTGTGGYLESTNARDSVELVCCVANTEWNVVSSIGNMTIV